MLLLWEEKEIEWMLFLILLFSEEEEQQRLVQIT